MGFLGALFEFKAFLQSEIARSLTGSSRIRIRAIIAVVPQSEKSGCCQSLTGNGRDCTSDISSSCIDL
jgi:hypothetical protein